MSDVPVPEGTEKPSTAMSAEPELSLHTEDHASHLEISTLLRCIEMFCITDDPRFALNTLPFLKKQAGYLQSMQPTPEAELQASLTDILEGTDRYSMAELQQIAKVCNNLWRLETSTVQITPKALQALTNQFKDKSTEELYIEHWLYRSFLISFQTLFDQWHVLSGSTSSMLPSQMNSCVIQSYKLARSQSQERGNIWDTRAHDQPDLHHATNGDVCIVLGVCIDQLESCLELIQTCHDTLPRDDSLPFAKEFAQKSIKEIMTLIGSTSDQESHIALMKHAVHVVQTSAVSRCAVVQDTLLKLIDGLKNIQRFRTSQYERKGLSIVAEEDEEDIYVVSDSENSVSAELHAKRREGKRPDNSGSVPEAATGSENSLKNDKKGTKDQERKDKGKEEKKGSQDPGIEDELWPVSNPFDFMDVDDDEEDVEILPL